MKTAVEWLEQKLDDALSDTDYLTWKLVCEDLEQAKEIENQEKLKKQLFIGKVSEIIGFEKTVELLKECNETFNK